MSDYKEAYRALILRCAEFNWSVDEVKKLAHALKDLWKL